MKVCQNCGHENNDKGKFCEECGTKLVEAPKFCPECGTKLEGTPKFCPECGSNLAEDTEVSDDDEHEDDSLDSDDDGESSENSFGSFLKAIRGLNASNDDDDESDDYDEEYTEEDEDSADYEEYDDEDEDSTDYEEYVDEDEYEDDETTEEKIREIVDKYLPIINKGGTYYRYAAVQNPEYAQVFQNVRSIFAKNTKQANLLGFIDTTVIGKGKNGLLFTNSAIYFKQAGFKGVYIPYSKISSMSIKGSFLNFSGTAGNGFFNTDISIIDVINLPALKDCLEEIIAII